MCTPAPALRIARRLCGWLPPTKAAVPRCSLGPATPSGWQRLPACSVRSAAAPTPATAQRPNRKPLVAAPRVGKARCLPAQSLPPVAVAPRLPEPGCSVALHSLCAWLRLCLGQKAPAALLPARLPAPHGSPHWCLQGRRWGQEDRPQSPPQRPGPHWCRQGRRWGQEDRPQSPPHRPRRLARCLGRGRGCVPPPAFRGRALGQGQGRRLRLGRLRSGLLRAQLQGASRLPAEPQTAELCRAPPLAGPELPRAAGRELLARPVALRLQQ